LFHGLEDNLPTIKKKRLNLLVRVVLEVSLEVCCCGIPQMWLSMALLPSSSSCSVKPLMFYFLHCKVFCLIDSEVTALYGERLGGEDVIANLDQLLGILLAMQLRL